MRSEVGFKITWHQKKIAIKPQPFPFDSQLCSSQIPGPLHFPCTFNVHSSNLHLMQAAGCKYPQTMTLILSILKPPFPSRTKTEEKKIKRRASRQQDGEIQAIHWAKGAERHNELNFAGFAN